MRSLFNKSRITTIAAIAGASILLVACGGDSSTPAAPAATTAASVTSLQTAPGTVTRPILSASEASSYIQANYLAQSGTYAAPVSDPWTPAAIDTTSAPNFIVGRTTSATHNTIQKAVNAAILLGGTNRIYIQVLPGTYSGVVYVPASAPPITIYGAGTTATDVVIEYAIDAYWDLPTYISEVNPSGQFLATDPAWSMFSACSTQTGVTKIDTPCAAVVWGQSNGLQLKNLTISNMMPVASTSHQAVALRTDGDKTQLESVRLIGGQDTFFVNSGDPATPTNKMGAYQTTRISRAYINSSYIEGDIDFVFGRANAVFNNCDFNVVSTRGTGSGYIFAPDTVPAYSYGFLVMNSRIAGDPGFQGQGLARLGRSWDQGSSSTGYLPGNSPNGQIVIRDSTIDSSFSVTTSWNPAATSNRPFAGNIGVNRNLNDTNYNRLWEFNNTGKGTGQ